MSETTFPDIEIYIKDAEPADLRRWLETHFEITGERKSGAAQLLGARRNGADLTCVIVPDAVKGGFTSVYFEPNCTPWKDDMACAREAFTVLEREVRCSTGSWQEAEGESEQWLRITSSGESQVNWH